MDEFEDIIGKYPLTQALGNQMGEYWEDTIDNCWGYEVKESELIVIEARLKKNGWTSVGAIKTLTEDNAIQYYRYIWETS